MNDVAQERSTLFDNDIWYRFFLQQIGPFVLVRFFFSAKWSRVACWIVKPNIDCSTFGDPKSGGGGGIIKDGDENLVSTFSAPYGHDTKIDE